MNPPPLPPGPYGDTIAKGCAMGCGLGIASVVVSLAVAFRFNDSLRASWAVMGCGVLQWVAIVPVILSQRAKGFRQSPKGLIISGCIGTLLSTACAAIVQ